MRANEETSDLNATIENLKVHVDPGHSVKKTTVLPNGSDALTIESLGIRSSTDPSHIASAVASLPIQIVPASSADAVVAEKKGRFSIFAGANSTLNIKAQSECRSLHNESVEAIEQQSLNETLATSVATIPVQIVPANTSETIVSEKKGRFSIISSRSNSSPVSIDSPKQEDMMGLFGHSQNYLSVPIVPQPTISNLCIDSDNNKTINVTTMQQNFSSLYRSSSPAPLPDYQTPPNPTPKTIHLQIPISPARTIQGQSVLNVNQHLTQQHQPPSLQQAIPLNLRKGRFIVSNSGHNRANSAGSIPLEHSQPIFHSGSFPVPQKLPHPAQVYSHISQNISAVQSINSSVQGIGTPPLAPSTNAVERINSAVNTSLSGKGGLSSAVPGGVGKMFHFLDQLRHEITEADKMIKCLQTDVKFLRGKNKELESRCHDFEKLLTEERASKEDLELKLRNMRRRLKEIKDAQITQESLIDNENERHLPNQVFHVSPIFSDTNSPIGLNCMLDYPTEDPPQLAGDSTNSVIDAIVKSLSPVDLNQ